MHAHTRGWRPLAVAAGLLLALSGLLTTRATLPGSTVVSVLAVAGGLALMVLSRGRRGNQPDRANQPDRSSASTALAPRRPPLSVAASARSGLHLVLHLAPVALLTFVFPVVSHRLSAVTVGGATLSSLLLASSVTVPWLSQAGAMPIYRAVGHLIGGGDLPAIRAEFVRVWPRVLAQSLVLIPLFAVPLGLTLHWSVVSLAVYAALAGLHLAFAQALVVANAARLRWSWGLAWTAYAAALLLLPAWWFLPPVVGILSQLPLLRRELHLLRRPRVLDRRDVVADLGHGLLLGSVLWADKYVLFLTTRGSFPVTVVFMSLLPAVLAYNYYFVRLSPSMDRKVGQVRQALESSSQRELTGRSAVLSEAVLASVARTGLVGAVLNLGLVGATFTIAPASAGLVGSVSLASWGFLMVTVVSYKLDYIGQRTIPRVVGLAHLLAIAACFTFLHGGAVYSALAVLEIALLAGTLASCVKHWSVPEYTLFWKHATSW